MEKLIKVNSREELQTVFGCQDKNIRLIEKQYRVKVCLRAGNIKIKGMSTNIKKAADLIKTLLAQARQNPVSCDEDKSRLLKGADFAPETFNNRVRLTRSFNSFSKDKPIGPRTKGQCQYAAAIKSSDITFGLGPAGTGKTYLAMVSAVEALGKQAVRRIILTRPAIEAGESLGFLPGDMYEKISPYLRPLYDALYDMLEAETIEKYLENGIIEVVPLAYMRGRTLNDAFIILDEAQNCTAEQMKMFLTRMGFYSKAVITGDLTQSDLSGGKPIGLLQAQQILTKIEGIRFVFLTGRDVVRHPIVQKVIEAYDKLNYAQRS